MNTAKRLPVMVVRGQGTRLWDDDGKEYLDFLTGPSTVSLGHCHPVLLKALGEQAKALIHVTGTIYSVPQVKLAQLLVGNSCLDRVFFCNSGAEANEGAIKLARKWGKERRNGAYEIICALNAFHGRTLAAVTATGTDKYKAPFAPLPEGFVHVPFNDVEAIKKATTDKTVAVLLEPVQCEGGVNVPDDDYLRRVRRWCDEQGILLILDEVQTGIGRLGTLFAYQLYGVEPDVMTLAKGMGSGVPIGALLAKEHCSVFEPGDHGSTYGGNPLMTHVAYAVCKYIIDNDLPAQAAERGRYMERKLRGLEDRFSFVGEVRGQGLIWAVEFDREMAEEVNLACLAEGLIANNVRPNALRLCPPLTVSEEEIDQAAAIVERVLARYG
jgi:acetylornithine aminotransferase/acetylornithine/N-succinyldiaminopimelate aminotransferase